jgi:hypothetical protein
MKHLFFASVLLLGLLTGCSSKDASMTDQELNALKNPGKEIPPEAIKGMSQMGDKMKQQMEANAKAGVDSRGIPLAKTNQPPPEPGSGPSGDRSSR